MVCGAERARSDMDTQIFADLLILIAAWMGLTLMFIYLSEWMKIRINQNRLHNAIRYPRRHREK